jgi:hypothetical protein
MSFDADMLSAHLQSASEDDDRRSPSLCEADDEEEDMGEDSEENPWFRPHPKFPGKNLQFLLFCVQFCRRD